MNACLHKLADTVGTIFDGDSISLWAQTLFFAAVPYFIVGYMITQTVPRLTSRVYNYPVTLPEVTGMDNAHDPENGSAVKSLLIKGKYLKSNDV